MKKTRSSYCEVFLDGRGESTQVFVRSDLARLRQMAVPDFQTLMLPLLTLTGDKSDHTTASVIGSLAAEFALSVDEREELLPSGTQRRFDNRVYWAVAHLRRAGLLENVGKGVYRITDRGLGVLKASPMKIDMKYLRQFPEYKWNVGAAPSATGQLTAPTDVAEQTPEEILESTAKQLEDALSQQILDTMMLVTPAFFEQLVVDLLMKMGYGGSGGAGRRIGKSGDGGIDGTIDQDPLGLDVVYVQAKRWQGSVGRPVLQAFAGSLEGNKATKGLIITTSAFSPDAIGYVGTISKRIVLIDGKRLARLMIEHGLGVKATARYVVKQLDGDYFEPGVVPGLQEEGGDQEAG
jgi:restriction system protein